jgi:O-Antigen ligase
MTAVSAPLVSYVAYLRRSLRDPLFVAFLVTLLVSLIRAPDQPDLSVSAGSTSLSITPSDAALVLLGIWTLARLIRKRDLPRRSWPVLVTSGVFAGWILVTAAVNGADAFVAGGKFVEIAVLMLCAVYVIDGGERMWLVVLALVAMNAAADVWAVKEWLHNFGARQPSFLGEHDLAALSTMTLVIWFAHLYVGAGRHRHLAYVSGVVGVIGITLGAALASLIGVYLAVAALVAVAWARKEFKPKALVVTILVVAAITGGVLNLRADNLGFLRSWFGVHQANTPASGEPGAWSQRLIYAYIGGRVFLAKPILGTGWYPELPPKEYDRFLPDARRRFADQPAHYFPPADGRFIPQMTYDQVLYELGLVGAFAFLLLLGATVRDSARVARRWSRDDSDPLVAYVAVSWTASLLGVLAGIALFGGATVSVLFWLTLGATAALVAAAPSPVAAAATTAIPAHQSTRTIGKTT